MLPYGGALGDQPAWVVDSISGLSSEMDSIQADAIRPKRGPNVEPGGPPKNLAPPTVQTVKLPPKEKRRKAPKA